MIALRYISRVNSKAVFRVNSKAVFKVQSANMGNHSNEFPEMTIAQYIIKTQKKNRKKRFVYIPDPCKYCKGRGLINCCDCNGSGRGLLRHANFGLHYRVTNFRKDNTCDKCNGSGESVCEMCGGSGDCSRTF
jgi:DnaJ-class molecular chaperone